MFRDCSDMSQSYSAAPLAKLTEQFERLPGIGQKSAARLAYHVFSMPEEEAEKFARAILDVHKKIHYCSICCNLTDGDICSVCSDEHRDRSIICVVESPKDVAALEKTREFNACYHVLHGVISPMKGIMPDMLKIKELIRRLDGDEVKEVIMATNATVEGEATAMYISKMIKPLGVKVSRLAYGLPVGGDLEYADEVTLSRALKGRNEM